MRRGYGKKLLAIFVGVVLVSAFTVSQAFSWGSATHAYIDDHLGRKGPVRNLNEVYGGMAPDVFNYLFSNTAWLNYLYEKTHYNGSIFVWKKADTITEKAVAFGFVSHNGITGADLSDLSNYFLSVAIDQCSADYLPAVENTIEFVSRNLAEMKISY